MEFDSVIRHEKSLRVLAANEETRTIVLEFAGEYVCEINPNDVAYVNVREPKLLKFGYIDFHGTDGKTLTFRAGRQDIMAFIEVSHKEKNNFYLMFNALNGMGLDIKVY